MYVAHESVHIQGGVHLSSQRIPTLEGLVQDVTPSVIAVEYDTNRLGRGLYQRMTPNDVNCGFRLAVEHNVPVALVDTGCDMSAVNDAEECFQAERESIHRELGLSCEFDPYAFSVEETRAILADFEQRHPAEFETLVTQRDSVIAGHLNWLQSQGETVVAFLGANHVPGVVDYLAEGTELSDAVVTEPPMVSPTEIRNEGLAVWDARVQAEELSSASQGQPSATEWATSQRETEVATVPYSNHCSGRRRTACVLVSILRRSVRFSG